MTINSKSILKGDSILAKGETNDCVVYAVATAFNLSYDEAHRLAKEKYKREDRKGTKTYSLLDGLRKEYVRVEATNTYRVEGREVVRKAKVQSFAKANPKGTYFIIINRHALTIKDGVVYDNKSEGSNKCNIKYAFKIN